MQPMLQHVLLSLVMHPTSRLVKALQCPAAPSHIASRCAPDNAGRNIRGGTGEGITIAGFRRVERHYKNWEMNHIRCKNFYMIILDL